MSEWLWGGRGSRTTVADPYIPPPLATETSIPVADVPGLATTQSNLMLGTPGAMTLPSGGVTASNGVASSGVSSTGYVVPAQFTTASNIIPAIQLSPQQPVIDYEWTYSTIKGVTYEPVTVYDPQLGGYVTIYQEKQTESVLPWLHRKQVVRYQSATANTITGSTLFPTPQVSDTAERHIVNRLFPVSTVPSPPAQAVPVQTITPSAAPMTTYATDSTGSLPISPSDVPPMLPPASQPTNSTVMRSELPAGAAIMTIVPSDFNLTPQPYSTTISSQLVDTSPSIVSPSAHQVLYPIIPESNVSSAPINTTGATTLGHVRTDNTSVAAPANSASPQTLTPPRSGTPTNAPTLAPAQPTQTPASQDTGDVQPARLQDSLSDSERRTHTVELPPGEPLPPPSQSSPIPSIEPPSTGSDDIPLLKAPDAESSTPSTTVPSSTAPPLRTRPRMTVSPTRMSQFSN